ncbi:MAG TPA: glycosyltransferase family 4 protein, partial [Ktedonobacteraceae bacterium]|nr:glycosyltransferase family 4 protein [Ktedonobacteraceae bacterium]
MQVLSIHRGYFPHVAGAEMMTYCVAKEMQRRGHQVRVLCQSASNTVEHKKVDGIQVIGLVDFTREALKASLPWHPDIVHIVDAVWPEYPLVARDLARELDVPLVITPASAVGTWQDVPAILEVCRQADAVCVLTQTEFAQFAELGIPADRLVIIGQGPNLSGTPDPQAFRQRHQITGPMVLFLGRKVAFKGYKQLLQATAGVWAQRPDTHFVFAGPRVDEDCVDTFQKFADPRVVEISTISEDDKHSALLASDLVCLPSTMDVFPLVFVEAWACARPVLASPFPGIEEIVRHGQDGFVVNANPAELASSILHMLTHDA